MSDAPDSGLRVPIAQMIATFLHRDTPDGLHRDEFAPGRYLTEFNTLILGTPRRSGKSTAIMQLANKRDVVVTHNLDAAEYFASELYKYRLGHIAHDPTEPGPRIMALVALLKLIREDKAVYGASRIWLDEYFLMENGLNDHTGPLSFGADNLLHHIAEHAPDTESIIALGTL